MINPMIPTREHATGHDPERLAVRTLAMIASGGALGMLAVLAGVWGLLVVVTGAGAIPTQEGVMAPQRQQMGTPELVRMRNEAQREQRKRLDATEWVDVHRGVARIPIRDAMRQTAAEYGDIDWDHTKDNGMIRGREGGQQ